MNNSILSWFFFANSPRPLLAHRQQDDLQPWSSVNQFLGLVTCTVNVIALLTTAILEIAGTGRSKPVQRQCVWSIEDGGKKCKTLPRKKVKFLLSIFFVWITTILICGITMFNLNYCSLLPLEESENWSAVKFFGVQCNLYKPSSYFEKIWMSVFEFSTNPLQFPLACFSSLPVIVFVALNNQMWSSFKGSTEGHTKGPVFPIAFFDISEN